MQISKGFRIAFLFGIVELKVFSEDRENGEYKHFVEVSMFGFVVASVTYRTGACNVSLGTMKRYGIFKTVVDRAWSLLTRRGCRYYGCSVETYGVRPDVSGVSEFNCRTVSYRQHGMESYITCDDDICEKVLEENGGTYQYDEPPETMPEGEGKIDE